MDFNLMIQKRHSVRKYKPQKVEKEKLNKILEAARLAPTAANRQPQRLLILEKEESLNKLAQCSNIYGAPLAIVVCKLGPGPLIKSKREISTLPSSPII